MFKGPDAIQQLGEQVSRLKKQLVFYERELSGMQNRAYGLDQIVGTSDAVRRLKADIIKVASLDVPVLLVGESGTGKELVAHAIQMLSPRSGTSMVLVNAAALPANLVESELFGYEAGAFTGADRKGRHGKFEMADKGTLFLDEIGDMPTDMQAKLLRVLQDGTFERVGGDRAKRSDFRLISASNRNFKTMIAEGVFRLDLFYRISTITLRLPPLRERLEDIPLLADTFLANFANRHRQKRKTLDAAAITHLQSLPWPGNIRQLQHAVERATIFCDSDVVTPADFAGNADEALLSVPGDIVRASSEPEMAEPSMKLAKDKVEIEIIIDAMRRHDGNKKKVAETLNISRSYLYKKLATLEMK
jgi:transcriptional regulator with PAS, ATPase and Fis domain